MNQNNTLGEGGPTTIALLDGGTSNIESKILTFFSCSNVPLRIPCRTRAPPVLPQIRMHERHWVPEPVVGLVEKDGAQNAISTIEKEK